MAEQEEDACRHARHCRKCLGVNMYGGWQSICQEHWQEIAGVDQPQSNEDFIEFWERRDYQHILCYYCQTYQPTFIEITKKRICKSCYITKNILV